MARVRNEQACQLVAARNTLLRGVDGRPECTGMRKDNRRDEQMDRQTDRRSGDPSCDGSLNHRRVNIVRRVTGRETQWSMLAIAVDERQSSSSSYIRLMTVGIRNF